MKSTMIALVLMFVFGISASFAQEITDDACEGIQTLLALTEVYENADRAFLVYVSGLPNLETNQSGREGNIAIPIVHINQTNFWGIQLGEDYALLLLVKPHLSIETDNEFVSIGVDNIQEGLPFAFSRITEYEVMHEFFGCEDELLNEDEVPVCENIDLLLTGQDAWEISRDEYVGYLVYIESNQLSYWVDSSDENQPYAIPSVLNPQGLPYMGFKITEDTAIVVIFLDYPETIPTWSAIENRILDEFGNRGITYSENKPATEAGATQLLDILGYSCES
jgi:hypothetical protein